MNKRGFHLRLRTHVLPIVLSGTFLLGGCVTDVADDYSPEFSGNFVVTDESGDQQLNQNVLRISLHDGSGKITALGLDRPAAWLLACHSQIASFGYSDQGHEVHEMLCLGSDQFSYLFIHGKPGLEVDEELIMKVYKDRHDVKSTSGYIVYRYTQHGRFRITYALDRQK